MRDALILIGAGMLTVTLIMGGLIVCAAWETFEVHRHQRRNRH